MTTMRDAMLEANILYSVTAVVVAGLVVWVAMVLKTAKEPWARAEPLPAVVEGASAETSKEVDELAASAAASGPAIDADTTAKATPMALSEGRAKAAASESDDKDA